MSEYEEDDRMQISSDDGFNQRVINKQYQEKQVKATTVKDNKIGASAKKKEKLIDKVIEPVLQAQSKK